MTAPSDIISHEPATGAEVWRGPPGDVDAAVAAAQGAWPAWAALPLTTRIELMRRFANQARKSHDDLALLIARETGQPLWEAKAEVDAVIARVESAIRAAAERSATRKHDNGLSGTLRVGHKPHGVLAVITPFSQPALVPAGLIIPALIGGNCAVFKPSEKAPGTGAALAACFARAGVPEGVLQTVIGGPAEGQALVMSSVAGVLFAGSSHVGTGIARKLAGRPDRLLVLEMGGNNPLVVWDTPLIEDAAVLVVQSAFAGAGQRCMAARRLIVKAAMFEPLMAAVKRLTERLVVGAPFDDPAPYIGPVISMEAADGLTESFIWLMSHGGKPIRHMVRREGLPFVSPAIIDTTDMAERPDIELFGPLLQVIRVEDWDAAIAEANATRYGLAAGLIGGGPEDYARFWAQSRAGIITWNRPLGSAMPGSPLGGIGLSGNHRPGGSFAGDYCAYPVASAELEQPRASVGAGFGAPG